MSAMSTWGVLRAGMDERTLSKYLWQQRDEIDEELAKLT